MSDAQQRRLAREAATPDERARALRAGVRAGREDLRRAARLAAYAGDPVAAAALGEEPPAPPADVGAWFAGLARLGTGVWLRAIAAALRPHVEAPAEDEGAAAARLVAETAEYNGHDLPAEFAEVLADMGRRQHREEAGAARAFHEGLWPVLAGGGADARRRFDDLYDALGGEFDPHEPPGLGPLLAQVRWFGLEPPARVLEEERDGSIGGELRSGATFARLREFPAAWVEWVAGRGAPRTPHVPNPGGRLSRDQVAENAAHDRTVVEPRRVEARRRLRELVLADAQAQLEALLGA